MPADPLARRLRRALEANGRDGAEPVTAAVEPAPGGAAVNPEELLCQLAAEGETEAVRLQAARALLAHHHQQKRRTNGAVDEVRTIRELILDMPPDTLAREYDAFCGAEFIAELLQGGTRYPRMEAALRAVIDAAVARAVSEARAEMP